MINLELDFDEGILLQSKEINFYGEDDNESEIQELILTNKNLICVVDKGWFKTDIVIEKIPLSNIKVINERAQIIEIKDSCFDEPTFQILYKDGKRIRYIFAKSYKNKIPLWINAINNAVNGETDVLTTITDITDEKLENTKDTYIPQEHVKSKEKKKVFSGLAGAINGALNFDIQGAAEKAQAKMTEITETIDDKIQAFQRGTEVDKKATDGTMYQASQVVTETPSANQSTATETVVEMPPIPQVNEKNENKHTFCSNCGTKLNEGARFCHGCGAAVGVAAPQPQVQTSQSAKPETNRTERQQEFVGKVLKCPHCGGVINETTAICPECGIQITGKAAISSVQAFKEQLMAIESKRKKAFGGVFGIYGTADPADKQKLTLIRNFPIPNSIDDILEFMMLAIANIDVKLSKNTWANSGHSMEVLAIEMPKIISNAWVQKMEQCYKKAEIAFPNDPAFNGIQKMYFDKMKELKIKVN